MRVGRCEDGECVRVGSVEDGECVRVEWKDLSYSVHYFGWFFVHGRSTGPHNS